MLRKKRMAQGGTIEATTEKRADADNADMPREHYSEHGQDITANEEKMYTEDDYDDERSKEVLRGKGEPMHAQENSMLSDKEVTVDDEHDERNMEVMRHKMPGHDHEPTANEDRMTSADDAEDDRDMSMLRRMASRGEAGNPSLAQAIMKKYAEGGEVDLSENADESPNMEDEYNFDALRKENYQESPALDDLDYDTSKSEGHEMEDDHDKSIVSAIRKKARKSAY